MEDTQVEQVVPGVAAEVEQVTSVEPQAVAEAQPEPIPVVIPDPRIAELELENLRLNGLVNVHLAKIERLRTAKNAYRLMAASSAREMAGAHSQGDIYSSRRKVELAQEFQAIKDED